MAPTLQFALNLGGNFFGQVTANNRALGDTARSLGEARKGFALFDQQIDGARGTLGGFTLDLDSLRKGGALLTFDLVSGARAAYDAVTSLVGGFLHLGQAIVHAAAGAEDLDLAVDLSVGPERAAAISRIADSLAATTRFDDDVFKRGLLPFLKQGIVDTRLLGDIATSAADLATLDASGAQGVQAALAAFSKIGFKGTVDTRSLRELGISEADFFAQLGRDLGTSAEGAEKLAKRGEVAGAEILKTALKVREALQGGTIGDPALRGGQGLGATLERLQNLPENLLKSLAGSDGLNRIQVVLDDMISRLQGSDGDKVLSALSSGLEAVTRPEVIAGVLAVFGAITSAIGFLGEHPAVLEAIVVGIGALAVAAGVVAAAILAIPAALVGVGYAVAWLVDHALVQPIAAMWELGGSLVDGIIGGITGGLGRLREAIEGMGTSAVGWLRDKLGIASPSRAFAEIGSLSGEGLARGLESSEERVGSAARRSLAEPMLAAARELSVPGTASAAQGGALAGELHLHLHGVDLSKSGEVYEAARRALHDVIAEARKAA